MKVRLGIILFLITMTQASYLFSQEGQIITSGFKDETTTNPEQNMKWRSGQEKYSAKPKNMWEVGIHGGHFAVAGDVASRFPSGFGVGLHLRKAITYGFSLRGDFMYGVTKGYDARATAASTVRSEKYEGTNPFISYGDNDQFYRNYKSKTWYGTLDAIMNIGNIMFHGPQNKWNLYVGAGIGVTGIKTTINALNGNTPYDFTSVPNASPSSGSERKDNLKEVKNILDDDYETDVSKEKFISGLRGNGNIVPTGHLLLGVSRRINKRVNVSIEHKFMLVDNDRWDGYEYRNSTDLTTNSDRGHYTSIRVGINIGNFDKRTEPLYWVNPLDPAMSDLADLKQRPKFDLTDTDGDGVIDMIDQEKESPAGAPVDTRGIALDSDKDGIPDYRDKELFTPSGIKTNDQGIGMNPDPFLTESQVKKLIAENGSGIGSWYFPTINFDLDKYYVKEEYYPALNQVASVMQNYPNMKVVISGYTDNRNPAEYNNVLGYNRANAVVEVMMKKYNFTRDRFIVQYGGEEKPLIENLPDNHKTSAMQERQQYLNRRAEFKVAKAGDTEMARPNGKAGKETRGSSRPGPKYSGNTNSGY